MPEDEMELQELMRTELEQLGHIAGGIIRVERVEVSGKSIIFAFARLIYEQKSF